MIDSPPKWTGDLVGKMHINKVKNSDLAKELGVTEAYISMILNHKRKTKGARKRLEDAYEAVIAKRLNSLAATEERTEQCQKSS